MSYVELSDGLTHPVGGFAVLRHVVQRVSNGRGKNGKQVLTECGESVPMDHAVLFEQPTSSLGARGVLPFCRGCVDGDAGPEKPAAPASCDSEPPSNGHSNQACTLPNRHTNAHQNGKISWSGVPNEYKLLELDPQERQFAQNRELGEAIAETYRAPGPLAKKTKRSIDETLAKERGAPAPLRLEQLDVEDIERSPLNHRTRFEGIDELGVDIKVNGLRVPIKVRPMPADAGSKKPWQLIYGERRWRAAKAARVKQLPSLIAELDDLAVIKEQLVENCSRSDVHPLEEADGYQALIDQYQYDAQRIADETGKSKAYVYARLKLTALAPTARVEFFAGRLNASIALLIARIPDVALQTQATQEVLGEATTPKYGPDCDALTSEGRRLALTVNEEEITGEEDDDPELLIKRGKAVRVPMSLREAQLHLQRRYMLRLELAKFPIDDATLVPSAGACTTCDFRTGNQRELFADVSSTDVCTKPDCFADKAKAEGERRAREAEAKGAKVVTGKAAEKVFEKERRSDHPLKSTGKHTAEIASGSPYVDPRDTIGYGLAGGYGSKISGDASWDKLLGKKLAAKVPSVVVVHPETGEARELLDKNKAIEVLREAGKLPKPKKETGSSTDWAKQAEREQKKRNKEIAINDNTRAHLMVDVHTAALEMPVDETDAEALAWWKWLIDAILETLNPHKLHAAALLLDEDRAENEPLEVNGKVVDRVLAALKNTDQARAFLTSLVIEESMPHYAYKPDEDLAGGLKLLGLSSWDRYFAKAKEHVETDEKTKAKAAESAKEKTPAKPAKKKGWKS